MEEARCSGRRGRAYECGLRGCHGHSPRRRIRSVAAAEGQCALFKYLEPSAGCGKCESLILGPWIGSPVEPAVVAAVVDW